MNAHEKYIKMAIELARKGYGTTNPNPMVGAIIVKDKKVIATGYHKKPGSLHAEVLALDKAGALAKGATLYVNLEPCAHFGRTPPCTEAIIKSGIKKVYFSIFDPNPLNNGRGARMLKNYGIEVHSGILAREAKRLNEVFIKYITKNLPFVTIKIAESLDGKISSFTGDSKWITSEKSRNYAYDIRSKVDAVMVGINTILRDNPILSSRRQRSPIKVILDTHLKISEKANIFLKDSPLNIIAISKDICSSSHIEKVKRLSKKDTLIIGCPLKDDKIDLRYLLKELAKFGIAHLLVEGGGETIASFIERGLADRILFFIAPKIIGGRDAVTSVEGKGVARVKDALRLKNIEIMQLGEDILVKGDI